jgi:hypothetical protein
MDDEALLLQFDVEDLNQSAEVAAESVPLTHCTRGVDMTRRRRGRVLEKLEDRRQCRSLVDESHDPRTGACSFRVADHVIQWNFDVTRQQQGNAWECSLRLARALETLIPAPRWTSGLWFSPLFCAPPSSMSQTGTACWSWVVALAFRASRPRSLERREWS